MGVFEAYRHFHSSVGLTLPCMSSSTQETERLCTPPPQEVEQAVHGLLSHLQHTHTPQTTQTLHPFQLCGQTFGELFSQVIFTKWDDKEMHFYSTASPRRTKQPYTHHNFILLSVTLLKETNVFPVSLRGFILAVWLNSHTFFQCNRILTGFEDEGLICYSANSVSGGLKAVKIGRKGRGGVTVYEMKAEIHTVVMGDRGHRA